MAGLGDDLAAGVAPASFVSEFGLLALLLQLLEPFGFWRVLGCSARTAEYALFSNFTHKIGCWNLEPVYKPRYVGVGWADRL